MRLSCLRSDRFEDNIILFYLGRLHILQFRHQMKYLCYLLHCVSVTMKLAYV